eukprot:TRINITY_DN1892_c0_g1_i1.p1 TRINITY_DN1892_c0_g1~~TRINITY_DN1892_c0_g1_i1.p1  ORF type:complete len:507 (-),score=43.00 TRINITY_DN1892_c0_g1_i1:86-1606(-)
MGNLATLLLQNVRGLTGTIVASSGLPILNSLVLWNTGVSDLIFNASGSPILRTFALLSNSFVTIPSSILQSKSIQSLSLGSNGLIPSPLPDFSRMESLRQLTIKDERFFGPLPDSFAQLYSLQSVDIQYTELSGAIPKSLLSGPPQVLLSSNRFTDFAAITENCTAVVLRVSNNSLTGTALAALSPCRFLTTLEVNSNRLGPVVPASVLTLPNLASFSAVSNNFSSVELPVDQSLNMPTPYAVDLSNNSFTGPITDNLLKAIIRFGRTWYINGNALECPRHIFYPTLATFNKTLNAIISPDSLYLMQNYLCLPGNTTAVACPSLFLVPGPAETGLYRTFRQPCKPLPWSCSGRQPALDAPCIAPGVWLILGSIQSTPSNPIIIGGNTTVQGNFSVPAGTGITVNVGSTVTVQGCVSISGDLTVDVSQNKPTMNGTSVDVILFGSGCNGSDVPDFRRVSVVGVSAADCVRIEAQDQASSRSLSVVFTVYSVPGCNGGAAPAVDGVSS